MTCQGRGRHANLFRGPYDAYLLSKSYFIYRV